MVSLDLLRLLPSIALRIPTAHNFTRALQNDAFSLWLDLAIEVNRHFLENERDLSFFLLY